jgi:hypothetical protein
MRGGVGGEGGWEKEEGMKMELYSKVDLHRHAKIDMKK